MPCSKVIKSKSRLERNIGFIGHCGLCIKLSLSYTDEPSLHVCFDAIVFFSLQSSDLLSARPHLR